MLPTFLGLGAPRAGTTWLHERLAAHPQVFMPTLRKEVHFFDRYFDRGTAWYERFFPAEPGAFAAVGEITPRYLACRECPQRIASLGPGRRFIVMLRDPVDRAYSHYGLEVRNRAYRGTFAEFIEATPEIVDIGRYASHIRRYLAVFDRAQFAIMVQEEVTKDEALFRSTLAPFLGLDPAGFSAGATSRTVNRSYVPRHPRLYAAAQGTLRWLNRHDKEWVGHMLRRSGLRRLLARGEALPPMSPGDRERMREVYRADVKELEELLGRKLPWTTARELQ